MYLIKKSEMYSSSLLEMFYSSMFLRIRTPSLLISFFILISSLFYGSLFSSYLMLFCVTLFPPNIYEILHSKIEFASVMLLQIFSLIRDVINDPTPHSISLCWRLFISASFESQSSAYHSSIYFFSFYSSSPAFYYYVS